MIDHTATLPSACRWCGVAERDYQLCHPEAGWHTYEQPAREQIHIRMRTRFARPTDPEEPTMTNDIPDTLNCPETDCPTTFEVSPEDPDATLSEIVNHLTGYPHYRDHATAMRLLATV